MSIALKYYCFWGPDLRLLFMHASVVLFKVSLPFSAVRTAFAGERRLFPTLETSMSVQTLAVFISPVALVAFKRT